MSSQSETTTHRFLTMWTKIAILSVLPIPTITSQTPQSQLRADPAAITMLDQALTVVRGPGSTKHGFQLTGQVQSSAINAESVQFTAKSFVDGYSVDMTIRGNQHHTDARLGTAIRTKNQVKQPQLISDKWSPTLDYFPLHGWWREYNSEQAVVSLAPLPRGY